MTYHEAFMSDIIAHPADDTPRLVYADWLDDNGEPNRAEFVQVQCEQEDAVKALCDACLRWAHRP